MRKVAVIGIGQTVVSEHWEKSLKELAGDAILNALMDAHINEFDSLFIGNMMSAPANQQQNIGAYIADWVGARGSESIRVESACSSGSAAFRAAVLAVASNEVDIAVAAGVEKMTDSPSAEITANLATAADADWEVSHGVSFVALNALLMQRYLHEYSWDHSNFAGFSINAHKNALNNPFARFKSALSEEQYVRSPVICDPITLMDASPIGDGAAAVILVPYNSIETHRNHKIISVSGSSAASDTIAVHSRKDPLFEYHDAFTIMAALSLEACGFADRGKAPNLALEGELQLTGRIPVATMGGLKARGHPVGATGMYQIVEVIQQLRGEAGENQVKGAVFGMAQNIGGSGSNIITHVLTNEN
jgi:acetyl-CoA C-acetyltransferase